jgi:acyl carrier protein
MIAKFSHLKEEEINYHSKFSEDLEVESLVVMEILGAVEKKYKIELPEGQLLHINTVGELVQLIEKQTTAG